ncbi:uncharacterized protein BJ171DRAFT_593500 [Polychytrium aggregatum]|uniref:uncharacterized protein n=1 Tax=Polychytrium aggregatum TaxID=110093 RepID=UPI0022FDCF80|nr:uncharacterized protein BJ171DRAFT_593500 [Polychytrium aggregatum]KAI9187550.1 hypothetical protein BJ171DRAFT_593500 [Polychytrium aggregatum]
MATPFAPPGIQATPTAPAALPGVVVPAARPPDSPIPDVSLSDVPFGRNSVTIVKTHQRSTHWAMTFEMINSDFRRSALKQITFPVFTGFIWCTEYIQIARVYIFLILKCFQHYFAPIVAVFPNLSYLRTFVATLLKKNKKIHGAGDITPSNCHRFDLFANVSDFEGLGFRLRLQNLTTPLSNTPVSPLINRPPILTTNDAYDSDSEYVPSDTDSARSFCSSESAESSSSTEVDEPADSVASAESMQLIDDEYTVVDEGVVPVQASMPSKNAAAFEHPKTPTPAGISGPRLMLVDGLATPITPAAKSNDKINAAPVLATPDPQPVPVVAAVVETVIATPKPVVPGVNKRKDEDQVLGMSFISF